MRLIASHMDLVGQSLRLKLEIHVWQACVLRDDYVANWTLVQQASLRESKMVISKLGICQAFSLASVLIGSRGRRWELAVKSRSARRRGVRTSFA